jgi:hypothetical protein
MKILLVLTSHDQLGNTSRKTGFWLEGMRPPTLYQRRRRRVNPRLTQGRAATDPSKG